MAVRRLPSTALYLGVSGWTLFVFTVIIIQGYTNNFYMDRKNENASQEDDCKTKLSQVFTREVNTTQINVDYRIVFNRLRTAPKK